MTTQLESQLSTPNEIDNNDIKSIENLKTQHISKWLKDTQRSLIFLRHVEFRKKYSNKEIQLYWYFYKKAKKTPTLILCVDEYIFFFVKPKDFFRCRMKLDGLRRDRNLRPYKIQIISHEKLFGQLLFRFFPDLCVHEISINDRNDETLDITLYFWHHRDRGIAIGKQGSYIKVLNKLLNNYTMNFSSSIILRCDSVRRTK